MKKLALWNRSPFRQKRLFLFLLSPVLFAHTLASENSPTIFSFSQLSNGDAEIVKSQSALDNDLIAQNEPPKNEPPKTANHTANHPAQNPPPPPQKNLPIQNPPPPLEPKNPPVSSQRSFAETKETPAGPIINFNNVSIVEFLRFVSRLTGRNFVFDPDELQFTVTIISESPATIDDVMAALLQNLRIHDFELTEQGESFVIYRNKEAKSPSDLLRPELTPGGEPQISTQVFLIEYVDPGRVGAIIKNMSSKSALIEVIADNKRLVVTDFTTNVQKVGELLTALDSPKSGLEIGQYVCVNSSPIALAQIAQQFLTPLITSGQTFIIIPSAGANCVFVVAPPFLVEKALSIMQTIDIGENASRIFSLDQLKFDEGLAKEMAEARKRILTGEEINQLTDEQIRKLLKEKGFTDEEIDRMTRGDILRYLQSHELGPEGLKLLEQLRKKNIFESPLPIGAVESTQFHIQKLQYRKADDVVKALHAVAASIQGGTTGGPPIPGKAITQSDLIITLDSLQVIEENNSIVLTGTPSTLQKAKDLIAQIDVPVKQVMIETLLLDTTLTNTLNFGVDSAVKWQRRNFALEGGLFGSGSTNALAALAEVTGVPVPPPPPLPGSTIPFDLTPNAIIGTPNVIPGLNAPFGTTPPSPGFSVGTIGRKILYNGHGFLAITGLLNAVRTDSETNIILNPKLTTEHNVPAELFVGSQVGIKGQSISNNNGNILTTNYEIRQTGVLLKITPLISDDNTITLIVEQSISQVSQAAINAQSTANSPPATVNETRTLTRVHLPSEHFVILSGLMREEQDINNTQIPCLGGLPFVGALFSQNSQVNNKHNLLLFLRPYVIENEIDIDDITKKQQEIWDEKSRHMKDQRGILDDIKSLLKLGYN